jgi:hypothetical protein
LEGVDLAFLLANSGAAAFRLLSTGRDTASVTVGFATAFFFLLLGRGVLAIVLVVPDACACTAGRAAGGGTRVLHSD